MLAAVFLYLWIFQLFSICIPVSYTALGELPFDSRIKQTFHPVIYATMQPQERPVYTRVQLGRYFDRLGLPIKHRKYNVSNESAENALEYLSLLQKHHLVAIPFENLSLHYSSHRQISLHSDELYKKIVESDSRGGYCMENTCIFGILLRSLGFQLYSAGARVNEGGVFNGW